MLRRNRSHCVGLYSFPSVLTQLPREGAIRSNTHSTQPYFRYTDGYSEPLPRQAAESPLRKRQHAQPRAGRPAVQEAPRAPHGRPGGVRPRPRSAAPSRTGRPGASRPAAGTQPTAPPRPRSRHSRPGARALRAGPARLPLASRWPLALLPPTCPPRDPAAPPEAYPERGPQRRESRRRAARSRQARLGAARPDPPSPAAAAGGAAEAAPIRALGGAGRDGSGPAGEVRGTPPPRRARHRAARVLGASAPLEGPGLPRIAEPSLRSLPSLGPQLFVGPWCPTWGSRLSAAPEISVVSRILFRTSVQPGTDRS